MTLSPYWSDDQVSLYLGDALEVLREMEPASVDAVVTDPPYGLEFMGSEWDGANGFRRSLNPADAGRDDVFGRASKTSPEYRTGKPSAARIRTKPDQRTNGAAKSVVSVPESYVAGNVYQQWCEAWARECLRVLKPGGHMLTFGGTRTWHRLTCAIEDAGFEIRDSVADLTGHDAPGLMWIQGSGFPKSLDVSKAIDKRRDDGADVDRVRSWLDAERRKAGVSLGRINDHFGHSAVGGGSASTWTTNTTARAVPTRDQWESLRGLIGFGHEMDAEVAQLNERKGTPGHDRERQAPQRRSRPSDSIAPTGFGADGWTPWSDVPATAQAAAWQGWGTALKPAWEPIVVARKPLAGTVAANVLEHGTGALNIAGCRVGTSKSVPASPKEARDNPVYDGIGSLPGRTTDLGFDPDTGRWPPNVLLAHLPACELVGTRRIRGDSRSGQEPGERQGGFADVGAERGSKKPNGPVHGDQTVDVWDCAPGCHVAEMDRQGGVRTSGDAPRRRGSAVVRDCYGEFTGQRDCPPGRAANEGGASRFFPVFKYEPKAGADERPRLPDGTAHPTVKPRDLIAWLVRLVTPPGALVLDPFAGSGTTGEACVMEGRRCVLIEQHAPYCELIKVRLSKPIQPGMFDLEAS
jgi:DNA modification methylase